MLNVLAKRLKKMDPQLFEKVNEQFLWQSVLLVSGEAKLRVPVDQGRLRDSITGAVKTQQERLGPQAQSGDEIDKPSAPNEGFVGSNVEYALAKEFGSDPYEVNSPVFIRKIGEWRYIGTHPGVKAKPFLRPALDKHRGRIRKLYQDELLKAVRSGQ